MPDGVAAAVFERFHYVFTEKLLPHKPEFQIMVAPIICYWVVAVFYDILDRLKLPATERYRIVRKRAGSTNRMSMAAVVQRVLLQHFMQFTMAVTMFLLDPHTCDLNPRGGVVKSVWQVCLAMFLMDTWQYFIHRLVHVSAYLYKHVHSTHHKLYVPYAYGALYNHPIEAVLLDSLGGVVSQYASGISCDLVVYFFCFATVKTVLDHCGYRYPVNPLHDVFPNSAAFHDVHHDIRGIKKNFSQPFFTHWDRLLGTYVDPATFHVPQAEVAAKFDVKAVDAAAATAEGDSLSGEEIAAVSSDETPADSGSISDAGSEDGHGVRESKKAQ